MLVGETSGQEFILNEESSIERKRARGASNIPSWRFADSTSKGLVSCNTRWMSEMRIREDGGAAFLYSRESVLREFWTSTLESSTFRAS